MKIRVGNWKIDSRTLLRFEWRKFYPKLIVHEKFEKKIKWTLRILTAIGIGTSIVSLPPVYSLILTLALLGIEQFFEKVLFEYTIFIIQPFPDFEVEYNQWLTNGYLFPNPDYQEEYNLKYHFGPTYKDREYAINFFEYLMAWNQVTNPTNDLDNNICISFVLEDDNSYTTYLYANPNRKWLDDMFNQYRKTVQLEKYGKNQQSMVMQMIYWKNIKIVEGTLFTKFINEQPQNGEFYFMPFYIENGTPVPIEGIKILKRHYNYRKRSEINENDIEYHYR